jgi:hypothetical protein
LIYVLFLPIKQAWMAQSSHAKSTGLWTSEQMFSKTSYAPWR